MRFPWRELLAAAMALPSPGAAQQIREIGLQAVATASDPALVVAGVYGGLRTSGRTRVSASLGAGVSGSELAWRGELLAHFLLSPEERRRAGAYVAGGIAAVEGAVSRGYLVLTIGIEQRPRSSSGWALEVGVGGGARIGLGYRWRWFPGIQTQ
jgi:hypothetical protein